MRNLSWKFNSIDVNFIAVIWITFLYVVAVSTMFYVVPTRPQYFYSLGSSGKSDKMDFMFLIFLGFEIYAKMSQAFMMTTECFSLFPFLPPTSFWMNTLSRLATRP